MNKGSEVLIVNEMQGNTTTHKAPGQEQRCFLEVTFNAFEFLRVVCLEVIPQVTVVKVRMPKKKKKSVNSSRAYLSCSCTGFEDILCLAVVAYHHLLVYELSEMLPDWAPTLPWLPFS